MDGWNSEDVEEIVAGKRRMRVGRRRSGRGIPKWVFAVVVLVLIGGGVGAYLWIDRPTGLATIPNPAVVAPGGFRASIGANKTITVGLEVRNTADVPLTLLEARVIAPAGLTSIALALIPTGDGNEGFALDGDLPATAPIQLGTSDDNRNAIIAARFTVDCNGLLASDATLGEQIFVTIKFGNEQREEELTPPVVGDQPWLTGTAQRVCLNPLPTGDTPEQPLPPLPSTSSSPTGGTSG